jgi:saccharopine dehydrogenase-like NADP-dependent oxidoreductase
MTRVGVLGATGRVGMAVLRGLNRPDIEVVAAGRSRDRVVAVLGSLNDSSTRPVAFDLFDVPQLENFCRDVELVINCAGPSGVVLDRVISAAVRTNRPAVDPGGYDPVLARLETIEKECGSARAPIVVGAGLLPGLSGLYPRWVADRGGAAPDRLDIFYAGTDAWAPASAWDIIQSLVDFGAERPPSYYAGGEVRAVPFRRAFRTVSLPQPIGRVRGLLVYTEELGRLARTLGIAEVHCHGTNNGRWSGLVLGLVKLAKLYRSPKTTERSARWLSWASQRDQRNGQPPCFAIDCLATWRDGSKRHARIVVGDTYEATGAILASVVRLMIDGQLRASADRPMIGMMHEMFGAEPILRLLRASGCILEEEMLPC